MHILSPRNSPRQSAIAEGFGEAKCFYSNYLGKNIAEVVISQQSIYLVYKFQYLFLNKVIVYKQKISLAHSREVSVCSTRSQFNYIFLAVYSSSFFLFMWQWNKLCFQVLYHRISKILLCHIFKQLLFCFILLSFAHLPAPKKNKTCDIKQKIFIYIFLLKFLFSLLSIFPSYLSLLLNSNKAPEIIFKTIFDMKKEHAALHITIFVHQNLYNNNCKYNTSYSW